MSDAAQPKPEPTRAETIGKIVARLTDDSFGTGPLAELRRLDPTGPLSEPALHRMLARQFERGLNDWAVRDWALVIHCLALAAPDNLRGKARLGEALFKADFKEARLVNLLDASPEELRIRLPRAARFVVQRGGSVHGPQLADLVLTSPESDRYAMIRRGVAADYYRSEHSAAQPETAVT